MSEHADRRAEDVPDQALDALRTAVEQTVAVLARLPDGEARELLAEIGGRICEIDVEP